MNKKIALAILSVLSVSQLSLGATDVTTSTTTESSSMGASGSSAPISSYRVEGDGTNIVKTNDFGVGVKWGTLTGLGVKYWADEDQALDVTLAFDNGNTALGADWLWHFRSAMYNLTGSKDSDKFVPYIGGGLIAAFGSNTKFFSGYNTNNFGLAVRVPVGLEFLPLSVKLGIFAEVGPGFGFIPSTCTFITADLGARYYF